MFVLNGPEHPVQALAFAPNSASLYVVHGYVGVHAWNLTERSGRGLEIVGWRIFGEFAIHPGGRWAFGRCVGSDQPLHRSTSCLLDLNTGRAEPFNFIGVVGQHIAISRDGACIVTIGHSDDDKDRPVKTRTDRLYGWKVTATGPEYAWHLDTPEEAKPWRIVFAGSDTLVTEDWIPDGPNVLGTPPTKPRLCICSALTGEPRQIIDSPNPYVEQLLSSPDGKQVVVRRGTMLWVYDSADWKKPPAIVAGAHKNFLDPRAAAFHPSGHYLLLANNGPSVIVFDTKTWEQVHKWKWNIGVLRTVVVSPDGTLAAAAGPRGTVVVWDLDL